MHVCHFLLSFSPILCLPPFDLLWLRLGESFDFSLWLFYDSLSTVFGSRTENFWHTAKLRAECPSPHRVSFFSLSLSLSIFLLLLFLFLIWMAKANCECIENVLSVYLSIFLWILNSDSIDCKLFSNSMTFVCCHNFIGQMEQVYFEIVWRIL